MERTGVQVESGRTQGARSSSSGLLQRQCACGMHTMGGGQCAECAKKNNGLQRKLAIGASNDPLEKQADQVGMHVSNISSGEPHTQSQSAGSIPAELSRTVGNILNEDFSNVKVHADKSAHSLVRSEGAVALAKGEDIYISPWAFRPQHPLGRGLIAHELTHVAQQRLGHDAAMEGFLVGAGHEKAIHDLLAERQSGVSSEHWKQITSKNQMLTPAPLGMTQRCIAGCKSCEKAPSIEEQKAELRLKASTLKNTIDNPSKVSLGELAAANAKYKDVMHDLEVLERGYGTHVGNEADDLGQNRTPPPSKTDCTEYTVSVLADTFKAKGQGDTFKKILGNANKSSGGKLKGTKLIEELQTQAGWKAVYWNPDTKFVDKKADGTADTEHKYSAHVAKSQGTYYSLPIEKDKMVVDYNPKLGTGTTQKLSEFEKLKKLPFGVIAARGGTHIAMLVSGVVYEVHWKEQCTSQNVFEATPLESWAWLSGIVAAPAIDIDNAWK